MPSECTVLFAAENILLSTDRTNMESGNHASYKIVGVLSELWMKYTVWITCANFTLYITIWKIITLLHKHRKVGAAAAWRYAETRSGLDLIDLENLSLKERNTP